MKEEPIITEGKAIPWYKTRKFWAVVFVIIAIYAFVSLYSFLSSVSSLSVLSGQQLIGYFIFSSGGALFLLLGSKFFGVIGVVVFVLFFYTLMLYLMYKTFNNSAVTLFYPVSFTILFILGSFVSSLFVSGL